MHWGYTDEKKIPVEIPLFLKRLCEILFGFCIPKVYTNFKKWELRVQVYIHIHTMKNLSFFPWKFIFSRSCFSLSPVYVKSLCTKKYISLNISTVKNIFVVFFCIFSERRGKKLASTLNGNSWAHNIASLVYCACIWEKC